MSTATITRKASGVSTPTVSIGELLRRILADETLEAQEEPGHPGTRKVFRVPEGGYRVIVRNGEEIFFPVGATMKVWWSDPADAVGRYDMARVITADSNGPFVYRINRLWQCRRRGGGQMLA